jgi:hypothetical protein
VLEPRDGGRTRLIERFRVRFEAPAPTFRVIGPLMGFGVFVMLRRQLLGIRERAELTAVAPPLGRADVKRTEIRSAQVPANGRSVELAPKAEIVAVGA